MRLIELINKYGMNIKCSPYSHDTEWFVPKSFGNDDRVFGTWYSKKYNNTLLESEDNWGKYSLNTWVILKKENKSYLPEFL